MTDNLTIRVDGLESAIESVLSTLALMQNEINQNKEDIKDLINRVNCLEGKHEYDKTQTIYIWDDNWQICYFSVPCKHCSATWENATANISYSDFKLTATFDQKDGIEPAVLDISDAREFTTDEIKMAVSRMISRGETDSVEVRLTLAKDAGSDVFEAILEGMTYAEDGTVNLILNGVETIPEQAFANNKKLKSVTLGDGVKTVGTSAFLSSSLKSITLGSYVKYIGEGAFWNTALTKIDIPDNVTTLGNFAFEKCTSLASVTLGSGILTIPFQAFVDCTSLKNVNIPSNVTTIEDVAFGNTGLMSIVIPDTVTYVGIAVFSNCVVLESVSIGSGITTISSQMFKTCTSLKSINIPSTATSIGASAFIQSGLTSVIVPDSVKSIGENAFGGCKSLTSITIGNGVTEMSRNVFNGDTALTEIIFRGTITKAADGIFRQLTTENVTLTLAEGQKVLVQAGENLAFETGVDLIYGGTEFCGQTFKEIKIV